MNILIGNLKERNLECLNRTFKIYKTYPNQNKVVEFKKTLENVVINYENRFEDFKIIQYLIELHNNLNECPTDEVPIYLREELIKMKSDF